MLYALAFLRNERQKRQHTYLRRYQITLLSLYRRLSAEEPRGLLGGQNLCGAPRGRSLILFKRYFFLRCSSWLFNLAQHSLSDSLEIALLRGRSSPTYGGD